MLLYQDYPSTTHPGAILMVFCVLLTQSVCGMSLGLFITSFFSSRDQVIQVSTIEEQEIEKTFPLLSGWHSFNFTNIYFVGSYLATSVHASFVTLVE